MPPTWSSRILAGSSSSSAPQRRSSNSNNNNANKPLPRVPDAVPGSPTRASPSKASHNRTASNPLPKFFGRKRSTGNLGTVGDGDGLVDDALVPVLDQPLGTRPLPPGRVISGKKKQLGPGEEDDGKTMHRCMCCDSRVRVPRDLDKFRCMCCLTVNDLVVSRGNGKDAGRDAHMKMPLSVERTRAIIEKCLAVYLQDRCKRHEERIGSPKMEMPTSSSASMRPHQPVQTPPTEDHISRAMTAPMANQGKMATQSKPTPLSASPPDIPKPSEVNDPSPSAAIRDFADFDLFAGTRLDTPAPTGSSSTPASGTSMPPPIARKPVPSHPTRKPPPPPIDAARSMPPPPLRQSSAPTISVNGERPPRPQQSPRLTPEELEQRKRYDRVKTIFRPLEDYMVATFGDYECLNSSFSTIRPTVSGRTKSESHIVTPPPEPMDDKFSPSPVNMFSELDAKMLLLGDIGENGSWWAAEKGD